jgi:hypothetical protein
MIKYDSLKSCWIFIVFETESHFVTQAGFKLMILLTMPPEVWDYSGCHHAWLEELLFYLPSSRNYFIYLSMYSLLLTFLVLKFICLC